MHTYICCNDQVMLHPLLLSSALSVAEEQDRMQQLWALKERLPKPNLENLKWVIHASCSLSFAHSLTQLLLWWWCSSVAIHWCDSGLKAKSNHTYILSFWPVSAARVPTTVSGLMTGAASVIRVCSAVSPMNPNVVLQRKRNSIVITGDPTTACSRDCRQNDSM